MVDRHSNKSQLLSLKAATRQQVIAGGGCQACVQHSRITRYQAFSEYGLANAEIFMPVDVLLDLTLESGDVSVLQVLARTAGHEVVALPKLPSRFADLQMAMGKTSKEVGEVFTRIGESLSDGTFDQCERQATIDEIRDAIGALVALMQVVEQGE